MAQSIIEQITTIERALGECMIEHAMVVVRSWLAELGENNPYMEAYRSIEEQYNAFFTTWLNADDPSADEKLNTLTGETYQLVDAVYAAIRLKRGLSPDMHGFNHELPQSVMHYFANCVQFKEEDLDWFHEVLNDSSRAGIALMAVSSLAKNLRDCFSLSAMLALIDGINAENEVVADQCMANVLILMIHYDIRMDFFPEIQAAFASAVVEQGDEGDHVFEVMCALVRSAYAKMTENKPLDGVGVDDLPDELRNVLEMTGMTDEIHQVVAFLPESEFEYMQGLMHIFPDSWLYSALIEGNEERMRTIAYIYLSVGKMDMMWNAIDEAEQWLVRRLRKGKGRAIDYINYGHCVWLKGDRMMAFENYRQARQMCKSSKEFLALFRPDRRQLVDRGVPLEHVYLIEDQLINS